MASLKSILIVGLNYAPEQTGIAPYTSSLACSLARDGVRVEVICAHPHYPEWRYHEGFGHGKVTSVEDGVRVTRVRHYVPGKPVGLRRLLSEVTFGVRAALAAWPKNVQNDPLVLVSPALFAAPFLILRAKLAKRPIMVWVQDIYTLGMTEAVDSGKAVVRLTRAVESWVMRKADRVIAIHDRFRSYLKDELGVGHSSISVIRNWTHINGLDCLSQDSGREHVRQRLGWQPEEFVLVHAGNMGVKQGLENVIEAARAAADEKRSVRIVLLGSGSQRALLERYGRGIATLQFLDSRNENDFLPTLQAADALLVNEKVGIKEMAVPSKLTSYFSSGVPVIAAVDPAGAAASEVNNAGAGLVVGAGEPGAILTAVDVLSRDRDLATRFGTNGLEYQRTKLSEGAAIAAFEAAIKESQLARSTTTQIR